MTELDQRVKYWAAQVRELVTDDVFVTERYNAKDIAVGIKGETTKRERSLLIRSLERAGCTIKSSVENPLIYVDATTEPLDHPYDSTVEYEK